jgi:[ribosomal protein S5]-alanine N-acetyltransferase
MASQSRGEMQDAKIYLRAFEPDDYRKINGWRRDEEIYRLTGGNRHFVSSERDRQWVLEKILSNKAEIYLAICLVENDSMIGYISLSDIDYRNSRAEWSGIVIGEEEYRGHGYASQAIYLLLEYAFDELGIHRVSGSWLAENAVSMFVGRMMGFRQEGVLRDYVYKCGKRHDMVIMSMLKPEFEQLRTRYAKKSAVDK